MNVQLQGIMNKWSFGVKADWPCLRWNTEYVRDGVLTETLSIGCSGRCFLRCCGKTFVVGIYEGLVFGYDLFVEYVPQAIPNLLRERAP